MNNIFKTESGKELEFTEGEMKIVQTLKRLNSLWQRHGNRLLLFNGNSLRLVDEKGRYFADNEIMSFNGIYGDGGCGGDRESSLDPLEKL